MSDRVYIFDTTLRDGEQSPGCSMNVTEKLKMAAKLVDLGVDILEAGFPIASEGDADAVAAVSKQFPEMRVAALARSNQTDVLAAGKSLRYAKRPRIHTFIATSDIHLKFKLKKSRQEVLDAACAAVKMARSGLGRRRQWTHSHRLHRTRGTWFRRARQIARQAP
mgnify:CR=1 FL=1